MTVFETIDGILTQLELPFYQNMPEFAREPPDIFIAYNLHDTPALRGDGHEIATRFFVTFNVFGKSNATVNNVYMALKSLLENSGFTRSGTLYTSDSDFPKYFRITTDYHIDL